MQFEQGPIRPPNEAASLLLRFTRNCPWNRCEFCPVYKGRKFSRRSAEEIREDILAARRIADHVIETSWRMGCGGAVNDAVAGALLQAPPLHASARSVVAWLYYGSGACFLQDADNLILPPEELAGLLSFLRRTFPEIRRVTTYARSRTVAARRLEDLRRLREAGLDRVHLGLESGSDAVLRLMKKGVSADRHVEAGRKLIEAGIEVSEYVMPGLGGRALWREHAVETARVLNRINPHFIRLRSLRVPRRAPLHAKLAAGEFELPSDDEVVEEIRVFLEHLEGITSTIASDHIMNLLEEVSGKLPEDRERMLGVIRDYQALPEEERLVFRVGRRGGAFRSLSDLEHDPATARKIRNLIDELRSREGDGGVERFVTELVDQYL
ncbi:MAG: radical SAM protein [Desulfobacterales bacterium]